jgi:eukaryotic translation initiation factor 2C
MPPRGPPRGNPRGGGGPPRARGTAPPGRGGGGGGPGRGGGGRGQPPAQTGGRGGAQLALAQHVIAIGVKKPGYGREGRPFQVYTNHFGAEISENIISHYDGQFSPTRFRFLILLVLSCNVACFGIHVRFSRLSRYA